MWIRLRVLALALLTGGALAQLLPLLLGPWITRLYSPNEFGQFSLVWALATNLVVVACARYEFALPRQSGEAEAALLMGLCLRVLLVVAALAVPMAALLIWRQQLELAWCLPLLVLAGAGVQWLTLWSSRARRFHALAWARLLLLGGAALAQLALAPLQLGAWGLLTGPLAMALLVLPLLARPAPQGGWQGLLHQPRDDLRAQARQHRECLRVDTPHAFAAALQDSLALLLIASWAGDASAGYWALALRYLKAPAVLAGEALSRSLYPRLLAAGSAEEALGLLRKAMLLLLALALPMMAALMLWGPALFAGLFGERWHDAGELARALAPFVALHFVAAPLTVVSMAWGERKRALRLALLGQLAFVAGLALGLHLGGLIGAAWGVSAAMLLYFGYFFWTLANWKGFAHESLA